MSVRPSTSTRGAGAMGGKAHTARVSPASALVLCVLRRLPLPRPLKGNRWSTFGAIIANESDIRILVEVWIGVEFSGDKGLHLLGRGGVDVGERIDAGIERLWVGLYRCVRGFVDLSLADDEGELEVYFVVVCELQEETRGSVYRFGVLINNSISFGTLTLRRGGYAQQTWTNSTGDGSPSDREAVMLVAGKPSGVILIADERRGLDIESEEIATKGRQRQVSKAVACSAREAAGRQRRQATHIGPGPVGREKRPRRACLRRFPSWASDGPGGLL